ncbi:MAG: hypothetical protein HYX84_09285 [Chloroflexi bacterium]|nr:hypothetical protein [Chloroflexota bacterium]
MIIMAIQRAMPSRAKIGVRMKPMKGSELNIERATLIDIRMQSEEVKTVLGKIRPLLVHNG